MKQSPALAYWKCTYMHHIRLPKPEALKLGLMSTITLPYINLKPALYQQLSTLCGPWGPEVCCGFGLPTPFPGFQIFSRALSKRPWKTKEQPTSDIKRHATSVGQCGTWTISPANFHCVLKVEQPTKRTASGMNSVCHRMLGCWPRGVDAACGFRELTADVLNKTKATWTSQVGIIKAQNL